ncbi:LuxR C-terminal-related transcriptional regulator [Candidatus Amarolinea dominans]|uniref:LuxR C-terminal-related transcriptional regulator n=1 Tax=Candidatus Amarolinea dominans TaxID=3140696 RepID=UPI003135F5B6|nr:helix-turn-helix transcriptional regulator [Anaerolineae bacterium]
MSTPILATKLYIPLPRPKLVLRPRLIERLNEGLSSGCKLTLISAPAGFGKTTLVSEWVNNLRFTSDDFRLDAANGGEIVNRKSKIANRVAWLSLDAGDNDPARFLTYLVAALQTIAGNIGAGVLAALESPQPPPTESILTALLNEITTIPDNFILVLDDYHLVEAIPVDQALATLLDHLPPQMHLVIATREDPHLPLARLRARGHSTELRAADLRFTPAEAADFLNQVMGLHLSAEDIAALETRTEGWIAGLQLAALSMRGYQDAASFIKSFTGSHHFVLDYLIEEVLQQQSESIQTFLLRTSILDRLCGPLCDAVLCSPSASGQETLEYLERANLFIVPLDNERWWYRYHHLFGELLRQRLGKPKEFAEFHLHASQWHEENGDLGAAFYHAIAAGDFVRAAGLAEAAWQGMNESFQSAAWLGWVKKLPDKLIRTMPVLCTQIAQAFTDTGELEASELRLQDAERCLDGSEFTNEAQLKPLPAMIALTRAYNAQVQGDPAATVKYAELALQIIPEDDFDRRARATTILEVIHWASGNLESVIRGIGDSMERLTQLGNHVFVVASAFAVADLLVGLGRLSEAERTYQDALQLAAQHGPEAEHITAHHHLGLSMIYRQRGDDTLAAHHLKRAAELGLQTTLVDWLYRWHVAQAQLKEAAGDLETALALLDEAKRVYIQTLIPDLRPIAALKARIYLKQGRPDKARAWAAERGLSLADEVSYLHEFEHLTLARLEIANPLVNALLARLLQAAEAQKRRDSALDILLVQALAHEAQGNRPQALAALERALALAEPEGYVRIFVDEGEAMRLLIEKQSRNRDHPLSDYVDKLLAAFTQPVAAPKSAIIHQKSDMIEPLSERELEVLKLLRTELSGPEIAGQLIVSLNTFRTHTKNIFDKLGVNNRRAAVRRAEELDLF